MYHTLEEFEFAWTFESGGTTSVLERLTDASLSHPSFPGGRTIGQLAWHIVVTIPEMMGRTGLRVTGVGEHDPVPVTADAIVQAYQAVSASLLEQIHAEWTDESRSVKDDMYGQQWTRGATVSSLVAHQTHHRGQLTILMRQAGLTVTGVYGPAREEWAQMGMEPPPF